ncbi:unnamed protein product [Lampetra planeri]
MGGLEEIITYFTDCPCDSSVRAGWLTLLAPMVIVFGSLMYAAIKYCKGKHLAHVFLLTLVASVSWLSVALFNSEAVCCIQGGFPSNSTCLDGVNATVNAVRYEKCTSDSRIAGVCVVTIGGFISFIVFGIVCAKCGNSR